MGTTLVGLVVSLKNAFSGPARVIQRDFQRMQTGMSKLWPQLKNAREELKEMGAGTMFRNALLMTAAAVYAMNRFVNSVTEAYGEQLIAIEKLDRATLRWGRNAADIQSELAKLTANNKMTKGGAAEFLNTLVSGGMNEAQIGYLRSHLADFVAFTKRPGESMQAAMNTMAQDIVQGNLAGIGKYLNDPFFMQRMHMRGITPEMFMSPYTRPAAINAMFMMLRERQRAVQGDAEKFYKTLPGSIELMNNSMKQLSATIGETLAPLLIKLAQAVTHVVNSVESFVRENPALSKTLAVFAALISLTPALRALGVAIKFVFGSFSPAVMFALKRIFLLIGLFALAIKTNFLGIGDVLRNLWEKFKVIFQGVAEGIASLTGTTATFSVKTMQAMQRAGVTDVVLTIINGFRILKNLFEDMKSLAPALGVAFGVLGFYLTASLLTPLIAALPTFLTMTFALLGILAVVELLIAALNILIVVVSHAVAGLAGLITLLATGSITKAAAVVEAIKVDKATIGSPTEWLAERAAMAQMTPQERSSYLSEGYREGEVPFIRLHKDTIKQLGDTFRDNPPTVSLDGEMMYQSNQFQTELQRVLSSGGTP